MTSTRPFIVRHSGKLLIAFLLLQLGGVTLSWFGLVPLEALLDAPKEEHRPDGPPPMESQGKASPTTESPFANGRINPSQHYASSPPSSEPKAGRLVIMVVDSMRYDFALSVKTNMPYLTSLVSNNKTFSYISKGRTPTITLGGIKAFTTGKYSPYTDLLFNLNAMVLEEDNLITELYYRHKTMHFYGDATWTDLFPYQFAKKDSTEPLYVIDTVEVDRNISRHLPGDLNSTKWDVLIVHYLGLDHIGHLTGPKNTLIKPKLREMDAAVKLINEELKELEKIDNRSSLFVLCSDHGMSEGGSHVGSTQQEREGAQIYMGSAIEKLQGQEYSGKSIEQVDMAATLAFFLGIPIPKINTGNIIEDILLRFPATDIKRALVINACQLFQVSKDEDMPEYLSTQLMDICQGKTMNINVPREEFLREAASTFETLRAVSTELQKTVKVREEVLLSSAFAALFPVILIVSLFISYTNDSKLVMRADNPSSEAAYLQRKGVFITRFIIAGSILLYSVSLFFASLVEEEPYIFYFFTATAFICLAFSVAVRMMYYKQLTSKENTLPNGHGAALLAVMKDEREKKIESRLSSIDMSPPPEHNDKMLDNSSSNSSDTVDDKPVWVHLRDALVALAAFLALFAVVHRWNNTGIRWLGQEDIGDYLIQPRNSTVLSILVFISQVAMTIVVSLYGDIVNTLLFAVGMVFSYSYRSLDDSVLHVASFHIKTENGSWMARIVFGIICAMILRNGAVFFTKIAGYKHVALRLFNKALPLASRPIDMLPTAVLTISLLCRVHNVIWFCLVLVMEYLLTRIIWPKLQRHGFSYMEITMLHLWMGKVTFFSQGNSNSLSSIDFSAGFTGIDRYSPAYTVVFTIISLLSGHIFWIVSLVQYIYRSNSAGQDKKDIIYRSCFAMSCYFTWAFFALSLAIFSQRHKSALWDVFAIKLVFSSVDLIENLITVLIVLALANLIAYGKRRGQKQET